MKKIILPLVLISTVVCYSQIINFPDSNFKARLLAANTLNGYACIGSSMNDCIPGVIDTNNNGEIETSEAEAVVILFLSSSNISDLTGIEYFTNLKRLECIFNNLTTINLSSLTSLNWLQCRNNQITSLDLSNLTQLKNLSCSNNLLTLLNISHQPELEILIISNNYISSLDFSNNPLLERVYCGGNLISSLDFSNNPAFFDLGCRNNPNLTTIKIKNGTTHVFGTGTYYNECWNNLPNLNYICADDNEIPALQSFLTGCGVTQSIIIDSDCPLGVKEFNHESFVVHPNPGNGIFQLTFNETLSEKITYSVYDVLGKLIVEKESSNNLSTTEINLENYPAGIYLLRVKIGDSIINKKLVKK
ncbi:T9SS type A sorting domain-containing protein [Flavobacterium macrobrachii]|uniref:T9SS type A sorting domain-containing protein n=1 Tax=Flavobacterium macrobrachii TaxID=591204 RepID=A0ABS2CUI5_9FLAO|nr:T9SS type A sorting domain-containing protein [Flavobacterium macrobrachii]MBM6498635.1 T9SS type A sorting domain-containing protein [Flavobacterium macrobrachii]